jgi:ribonuclease P protein component
MLYAMKRESSSIPVSVLSPDSGSFIYPMAQLPTRIGITISQKVSKRAVVRNRIRRRIQSALRRLLTSFSTGWDLVVVVSPQASQCEYLQFLQELEQLLIDAEVLHGRS